LRTLGGAFGDKLVRPELIAFDGAPSVLEDPIRADGGVEIAFKARELGVDGGDLRGAA
jgi:hypothetical protein